MLKHAFTHESEMVFNSMLCSCVVCRTCPLLLLSSYFMLYPLFGYPFSLFLCLLNIPNFVLFAQILPQIITSLLIAAHISLSFSFLCIYNLISPKKPNYLEVFYLYSKIYINLKTLNESQS